MILKKHLAGDYIVYDPIGGKSKKKTLETSSRPQGSLYNFQKRKVADACEWMRINQSDKIVALIFTLTTPGFTSIADAPKFVSKFFKNMRENYGMSEYVWVREYTKKGFPHFHCVALWHPSKWFFKENRIAEISKYWSGLFGSDAVNSVWLGGYWFGKRIYTLRSQSQSRYLVKYFNKKFNENDSEKSKRTRKFAVSSLLSKNSLPQKFESRIVENKVFERDVFTVSGMQPFFKFVHKRTWENESGSIEDNELKRIDWRWTGHFSTYIGRLKRLAKRGNKSHEKTV